MNQTPLCKNENVELVTSKQAASILGLSELTIRGYKLKGLIKAVPNTTSRTYFLRSDVEDFKKRRQQMKEKRQREIMGIV